MKVDVILGLQWATKEKEKWWMCLHPVMRW